MTQRGGRVDWDRLADHLGGALAGTPEGAEVARLVATDPDWADAAGELSAALDVVAADLRTLPEPTLPEDVAARLDAALRAAPTPARAADPAAGPAAGPAGSSRPAPRTGAAQPPGRPAGGSRRPPGQPGQAGESGRPGTRRSRRSRRRLAGWGVGATLAAGVVAFAAFGLTALSPSSPLTIGAGEDSGGDAPESSTMAQPGSGTAGPVMVASGTDYQSPTVVAEPDLAGQDFAGSPRIGTSQEDGAAPAPRPPDELDADQRIPPAVPPLLARLWADPAARTECLGMIRAALQPAPVVLETVDFARFQGQDALVVWASTGDGRVVWVSGPDCGTEAAGPDERFQTEVG